MNVISTSEVGEENERSCWSRIILETFQMEAHYDDEDDAFSARIAKGELGEIQLIQTTSSSAHSATRIGDVSVDGVMLCQVLSGESRITYKNQPTSIQKGDLFLLDGQISKIEFDDHFDGIWVWIPNTLIERRSLSLGRYVGHRVEADQAVGYIASEMIRATSSQLPRLQSSTVAEQISDNLVGVISAALSGNTKHSDDAAYYQAEMFSRIHNYIDINLHNNHLSPHDVAVELGVSLRYLNKIFKAENVTIARKIWAMRLERCRSALEDPAQVQRSVCEIAYSCGYRNIPHFNRTFKSRFGCTPSAYRRTCHVQSRSLVGLNT